MLYAQNRWSLLLVSPGDGRGRQGQHHQARDVRSKLTQGCQVFFVWSSPRPRTSDHDFFWRYAKRLPERGRIGIFNRSHYEDVLVARVHDHILKLQKPLLQLLSKEHLG